MSKHTVDTHRRNILKKTGLSNTVELIIYAIRSGIV
ncbi:MAG: response regulator transcription factor [Bacteroidetes bacterium]|nr:response regulator transcription factor [Bacteroidota bacterium]